MQQILIISGDSPTFNLLVGHALCDRYDRMLLIEVSEFQNFIYSGFIADTSESEAKRVQNRIVIEGAVATAAAANRAKYGAIIIDNSITLETLRLYGSAFHARGTNEVHFVSLKSSLHGADSVPEHLGKITLEYDDPGNYLSVADSIQDLVGRNETVFSLGFE